MIVLLSLIQKSIPMTISIQGFFDPNSNTISYLVYDKASKKAAIIDPVLEFTANDGHITTQSADVILSIVEKLSLEVNWIMETHAHADHLSAAQYLQKALSADIVASHHITQVQAIFNKLFNLQGEDVANKDDFQKLVKEGDILPLGNSCFHIIETPGHTPACVSYQIDDAVFVGDTIFMPDFGSARCDFPGGDAKQLYHSIQRLLALPDNTRLFMCHDYMPNGREVEWETTVAIQKQRNIHVHKQITEQDFIQMRQQRDKQLPVPQLLLPSIQVNIRAGKLPTVESNQTAYLKLPINAL